MSTYLTKRLTQAAFLASLVLPATLAAQPSYAAPPAPAVAQAMPVMQAEVGATDQETLEKFKQVLVQYGNFVQLEGYGEVWVPTVTPEGWHPYPPCHWIYAEDVGWYFRDDTPWGAIVHHYGRWSHDAKIGWFWVPDADWSPGWVVWRDSAAYTGWAPMPPDQEAQKVSLDDFNKDKMWIFMETPIFLKGCGDTVVASQAYDETEPVSIFELPRGHIVKVRIVPRWKIKVIRRIIVVDRRCPPRRPRPNDPPPATRTLYDTLQPPKQIDREFRRRDRHTEIHIDRHIERHPGRHVILNPGRLPIHPLHQTARGHKPRLSKQIGLHQSQYSSFRGNTLR
jgi:hypothetical protein